MWAGVRCQAGGGSNSAEDKWRRFFADPARYWDNRFGKRNPKAPDFKHKDSGEALWIIDRRAPRGAAAASGGASACCGGSPPCGCRVCLHTACMLDLPELPGAQATQLPVWRSVMAPDACWRAVAACQTALGSASRPACMLSRPGRVGSTPIPARQLSDLAPSASRYAPGWVAAELERHFPSGVASSAASAASADPSDTNPY